MSDIEDVYLAVSGLRDQLGELLERFGTEPAPAPRRRVTKDDVLAGFLASINKAGGERSSVRLARNAKGDMQFEIVVRTGDTASIETAEQAVAEANRLAEMLATLYPMSTAPERAPAKGGEA